jgi:hypothetical protein
MDDAHPARPGAPSAGRKTGRNTVADRVTVSQQAKDLAASSPVSPKQREVSRAKMVEEINRKFFDNRLKPVEKESPRSAEVAEEVMASEDFAMPVRQEEMVSQYEPKIEMSPKLSIEA